MKEKEKERRDEGAVTHSPGSVRNQAADGGSPLRA